MRAPCISGRVLGSSAKAAGRVAIVHLHPRPSRSAVIVRAGASNVVVAEPAKQAETVAEAPSKSDTPEQPSAPSSQQAETRSSDTGPQMGYANAIMIQGAPITCMSQSALGWCVEGESSGGRLASSLCDLRFPHRLWLGLVRQAVLAGQGRHA